MDNAAPLAPPNERRNHLHDRRSPTLERWQQENDARYEALCTRMDAQDEALRARLDAQDKVLAQHGAAMAENTAMTKGIKTDMGVLVDMMVSGRRTLRFISTTGTLLRKAVLWVGPFLTVGAGLWALLHGRWPEGHG